MPEKKSGMKKGAIKNGKFPKAQVSLAGFWKVNIVDPDGTVKGDSGWRRNTITGNGLNYYIMHNLVGAASSLRLGSLVLMSASDVASNVAKTGTAAYNGASVLASWVTGASSTSARSSSNSSATLRYSAAWTSGALTYPCTIGAVGMAQNSTVGSNTDSGYFCAGSFASSSVSSNQAVNVTYDIYFSA